MHARPLIDVSPAARHRPHLWYNLACSASVCCLAGVNYNLDNSLPQGVIYLQGVSVLFENSRFENLTEYGDGCIAFQDSTVAFTNSSFKGNTQATAGAIFANNTVLSVDDSTFTDNYGFQSGAIQMLGDNSMLYVNGTIFHNNTGGSCCAARKRTDMPSPSPFLDVHTCTICLPSRTYQKLIPCTCPCLLFPLPILATMHLGWSLSFPRRPFVFVNPSASICPRGCFIISAAKTNNASGKQDVTMAMGIGLHDGHIWHCCWHRQ